MVKDAALLPWQLLSIALGVGFFLATGVPAPAQSSSAITATAEPLGPSSRRTPLTISEIMYAPPMRADGRILEFVEIYNSQLWPENIGGYRLSGDVDYTFPEGATLPAEGFLVVAKVPADVQTVYGISSVLGPYSKSLSRNSGTLRLRNRQDAVLVEVNFSSKFPWPVAAAGTGHSLILARPSYGEASRAAWAASDLKGGSPGFAATIGAEPARSVMINEILAHTDPPLFDFIELYNQSTQAVDLSGCYLSDRADTNKFRIPDGTMISANDYLSFDETQLGFALSATGESVFLVNSNQTRVLDAVSFDGQANGVSSGRFPNGAPGFHELDSPTPGAANSPLLIRSIAINELMYHPISENDDDEFVELSNRTASPVSLGGWQFTGGINYTFPSNAVIAASGYVVVAKNAARLLSNYPGLNPAVVFGNFNGSLANGGERVAIAMPDENITTNSVGGLVTNLFYVVVDEVTFRNGGRWGSWADGGGSSLELVDGRSDHRLAANWADSDESAKAAWTTFQQTGVLDLGDATYGLNTLQLLSLGAGEYLVDDVEVLKAGANNLILNPSFENGLTNWTLQGNHDTSFLSATGGVGNSKALYLRTSGQGDNGANCIRNINISSLSVNDTVTLRAKARWLRGFPELLVRLRGNYLEVFGRLSVPANLGTPGARNSRFLTNAGPAIFGVKHSPILPAANQAVVVTALIHDPDGVQQAILKYRVDPGANLVSLPLLDDGTGGDQVAGDGIYSATIPGQAAGKLVAFHIQASDNYTPPAANTFPNNAPVSECLVRFGDPPPAGRFGAYRCWVTQATLDKWNTRLNLSNDPLDATFVCGNYRVIYNAGVLYAGSPYHSQLYNGPLGTAPCDYKLVFPKDDPFLGSDAATVCWPGLAQSDGVDNTAQKEQTSYWIAAQLGLPFNYRRYVSFSINGTPRSFIMEDVQKPDSDILNQWFPNEPDGDLYKLSIWREFANDSQNHTAIAGAALANFTSGGAKKTARYRWNWTPRAFQGTANTFSNLFALVDVVNTNKNYTASIESFVDIEQWMRTFAAEHIVGNWDSYGYGDGQNMYAYKPPGGKWKMLIWDMDVSLGNFSDPATADLFKLTNPYFPNLNGDPAVVSRMYANAPFRRASWRAYKNAVDGPLLIASVGTLLDAKYAAFQSNNIAAASPAAIKSVLASRRSYIVGQLASVAAKFAIITQGGNDFSTTNNPVTLTGTAPVDISSIRLNGIPFPLAWTSVTNWSLSFLLQSQTNRLELIGYDYWGHPFPGATSSITIYFTGSSNLLLPTVFINEWMAENTSFMADPADGLFDDWFELYNPGSNVVNLAGYYLTDSLANKSMFQIPSGYVIQPGGYLLVWADNQTNQNSSLLPDLHANFKLAKTGESIGLFAPDGAQIDAVTFGPQTNDISQGRFPDGSAPIYFMTTPTPRSENVNNGVGPGPPINRITVLGGSVTLEWLSQPGKTCRVQYKNNLDDPDWITLGNFPSPVNSSTDTSVTGIPQRFYRLLLVL